MSRKYSCIDHISMILRLFIMEELIPRELVAEMTDTLDKVFSDL